MRLRVARSRDFALTATRVYALVTALLLSTAFAPLHANTECRGNDIFATLREKTPAEYEAIEARAAAYPFRRGRLFAITAGNAAPSLLFGTLHLSDPRVTAWSRALADRVAKASLVVVESADVISGDGVTLRDSKLRAAVFAAPRQQADRLLDATDFATLETITRAHGLPENAARAFKPAALALLLDAPLCIVRNAKQRPYLDALLAQIARKANVPVIGLETLADQFDAVDGLGPDVERELLISMIRSAPSGEDIIETQIKRYEEDDPGAMLSWMRASAPIPGVPDARTPSAFLDRLLRERSRRMSDKLLPLLARGNVFVAIGAAHLPGPDGLVTLLQNAGMRVERID